MATIKTRTHEHQGWAARDADWSCPQYASRQWEPGGWLRQRERRKRDRL